MAKKITKKRVAAVQQIAKTDPTKRTPTLKQYDFAIAWCGAAKGNGTDAARIARYTGNDVTLAAVAYENLRKPQVIDLIKKLRVNAERQARKSVMTEYEVLLRLSQIADGSLADVRNEQGDFDLDDAKRRGTDYLVKSVRERRTIIHRPRYSRRRAGANAEYVAPKHDFRLTPEGKYLCVGCENEVELPIAVAKISAAEPCTMRADDDVERVEYIQFEYKIEDRVKALELLQRHYKVLPDWDVDEEIAKILGMEGIVPRENYGQVIDIVAKTLDQAHSQKQISDGEISDIGDIG